MPPSKFRMCGKLMVFESTLDACGFPVFSLGWRFTDDEQEAWTGRFNDFKYGAPGAQQKAVDGAIAALSLALSEIQFEPPVALVAAIGHADTQLDVNCAVHKLGAGIAKNLQWQWHPRALTKKAHNSLHKTKGNLARDAEVANTYSLSASIAGAKTVLVLDDFSTRGATVAEICRALQAGGVTASIYGVVLGKTDRASFWSGRGYTISNGHVPKALMDTWDKG